MTTEEHNRNCQVAVLLSSNYDKYYAIEAEFVPVTNTDLEKVEILREVFDKYTPQQLRDVFNL